LEHRNISNTGPLDYTFFLETKLMCPKPRLNFLPRPRLIEKLNSGVANTLTLLSAPAGSGKTALLSEWMTQTSLPTAYLALDAYDNDPKRLFYHLIVALQRLHPTFHEPALFLLESLSHLPLEKVLNSFINCMSSIHRETVLILDNYQAVKAQTIDQIFLSFFSHPPEQLHFIVATRSTPPFPLAHLRSLQHLTELTPADLLFTFEEGSELLGRTLHSPLSLENRETLLAYTEGWCTGLLLAGAALPKCKSVASFINDANGGHQYVYDYLEEVFKQQPQYLQSFLMQTSLLDYLCAPLCDAVTKRWDSLSLLQVLEDQNLFIVPLDEQRSRYRYLRFFKNFLHRRLQYVQADMIPALHRRALTWYQKHQCTSEAINYALLIGDFKYATRVIEQTGTAQIKCCEGMTLLKWLALLPDSQFRYRPRLCLLRAYGLLTLGRITDAKLWLENATQGIERNTQAQDIMAEIFTLNAYIQACEGSSVSNIDEVHQATRALPGIDPSMQSLRLITHGLISRSQGDVETACRSFIEARVISHKEGNHYVQVIALSQLGYTQLMQGLLHGAMKIYCQALSLTEKEGRFPPPFMYSLYEDMSLLMYEWNDLEATTHYVQKVIKSSEHWMSQEMSATSLLILARVKQAQGDEKSALELARKAKHYLCKCHLPHERLVFAIMQAMRLHSSIREITDRGFYLNSLIGDVRCIALARLALTQGRPENTVELLERKLQEQEWEKQGHCAIEMYMLLALAYYKLEQLSRAVTTLEKALLLAEPERYTRLFIDEGPPMVVLLSTLLAQRPAASDTESDRTITDYARELLLHMKQISIRSTLRPLRHDNDEQRQDILLEHLSSREMDIVECITTGMTNKGIAQHLVVSESTVKWHIQNILSKLNLHNRAQIVRWFLSVDQETMHDGLLVGRERKKI
jgi:LuxR family transcriptional regulator, maltose regulon positive regulatory protein